MLYYHVRVEDAPAGSKEPTTKPLRVEALEINREDDGFIVYQPETDRVHYFNHTGILILELCDGQRSSAEIADLVKTAYGLAEAPQREVDEILVRMLDEGLVLQRH